MFDLNISRQNYMMTTFCSEEKLLLVGEAVWEYSPKVPSLH